MLRRTASELFTNLLLFLVVVLVVVLVFRYRSGAPADEPTSELASTSSQPAIGNAPPRQQALPQSSTARPSANARTDTSGIYQEIGFKSTGGKFPFYVADKRWNDDTGSYGFYRTGMHGTEVPLRGAARRYMLSENQANYPVPQSGCGPTALLNLYIWYSKFGLINETVQHANPERYKQLKFTQIDRRIAELKGQNRTPSGGTNTLELVLALEEIMAASGNQDIRMHFELKDAPLAQSDFLNVTRGYRAGILTVRPLINGQLERYHAVLVISGDRSGRITLANWGKFVHGRMVTRGGKQWFIPEDKSQPELLVERLTTLIPFRPS